MPPVFEKESLLTGTYVAISRHLLSEVPFFILEYITSIKGGNF